MSRRYRSTARRAASARDIPGARVISLCKESLGLSLVAQADSPQLFLCCVFAAAVSNPEPYRACNGCEQNQRQRVVQRVCPSAL